MHRQWMRFAIVVLLFAAVAQFVNAEDAAANLDERGKHDQKSNVDSKEFIPTREWQEVGPDQAIPPGLHVRMDFQTGMLVMVLPVAFWRLCRFVMCGRHCCFPGKREAKLLDEGSNAAGGKAGAMVIVEDASDVGDGRYEDDFELQQLPYKHLRSPWWISHHLLLTLHSEANGDGGVLGPSELFDKAQNEHKNFRIKYWSPEAVQSVQEAVLKLGRDDIPLAELHQVLEVWRGCN